MRSYGIKSYPQRIAQSFARQGLQSIRSRDFVDLSVNVNQYSKKAATKAAFSLIRVLP
jgi:hypothetical protein